MKVNGTMNQCDRCGEKVFIERTGIKLDGCFGLKVIETFDDEPKGWLVVSNKTLCPACSKKYNDMWTAFCANDSTGMTTKEWMEKHNLGGAL